MGLFKKIVRGSLLRAAINGLRDRGAGQSGDWRRNLRYNAPRVARSALGDVFFAIAAIMLIVMFLVAGMWELIFSSPLSSAVGGAAKSILQTTPNQVGGAISNVSQSRLGETSIGGILDGAASGIKPLLAALLGLLDDVFGILMVAIAVIIRFSHRVLALLIGDRPASDKGNFLSWIVIGASFIFFLLGVFVW